MIIVKNVGQDSKVWTITETNYPFNGNDAPVRYRTLLEIVPFSSQDEDESLGDWRETVREG